MDLKHARSVGDTRTREIRGPYISEKDQVEHSPWADWERRNSIGQPNTKQTPLSDLFGNRWRRDAFDGLREAHEASGLYNKRLKFQDPPSVTSNDASPNGSGSGDSLTVSSQSICSVQRGPETQSYSRLNRDYYDPSLRAGMSGYPNASQDYEGHESDGYSTDEYEPEDQMHYSTSRMGPTRVVYNPETEVPPNYSASSSRKIGISDLLCSDSDREPRGTARSNRTIPPQPWELYGNPSAKSVNGWTTLTSPHDGYAPYETRETTQKTSTHVSDTVQSPASIDVRPSGLQNAFHTPHETNESLSHTPTPEPPQDSMYDYASYPLSPTTSTYLPRYEDYRLSSPEPYSHIRLPSPPYNDHTSLQHSRPGTSYDGSTRFQSQEKSGHKRSLNSRSRSPRRSSYAALDWDKPSDYHFRPPVELSGSGFNRSSRPPHDSAIGLILTVERRPPIPISKDFRPPNYRPNHLFRVLRRGPPQDDEPPHPMSVDDPSPIKEATTTRCSPPASLSPAPMRNSELPNRSSGNTPPPRSPSPPVPACQVSRPNLPLQQPVSAPMTNPLPPLSNIPTPGSIFSHYRPKLSQDTTCEASNVASETTATAYYRPHCVINATPFPVTAPAVIETEKLDHLEGTDLNAQAAEPSAKKAKQKKTTKRTPGEFSCGFCEKTFTRNFDMLRHQKTIHQNPQPVVVGAQTCPDCHNYFNRKDAYARHLEKRPGSCFKALNLRASAHLKAQAPESVQAILKKKSKAS